MSELEKTVAEILVKATNAAEAAGKFAMEQLPDVAQQYVFYVGAWNLFICAVFVLLWGLFIWGARVCFRLIKQDVVDGVVLMIPFFCGLFLLLATCFEFFSAAGKVFLAFFAPKVLLIQWAAALVK